MSISLYGEVFLTSKIENNGVLESVGNLCLWPLRQWTICLIKDTYSVKEHPLTFREYKKIVKFITVIKTTFLLASGIGVLGVGLKGASWLIPSVRNQNLKYIELRLQDNQVVSFPLFNRRLNRAKGKDESCFKFVPQVMRDLIVSFLDMESTRNLSLTCSNWSVVCDLSILYKKVIQKRYPTYWIEALTLDELTKIPKFYVSSKVLQTIREPIRCLSPEEMGSNSIIQGIKNHIPFLAIRYLLQNTESTKMIEGIVVWWNPTQDSQYQDFQLDLNQGWRNANAYYDTANIGFLLEKQSHQKGKNLFLECLKTLLRRESYSIYQEEDKIYYALQINDISKK
jgi:hypothetical protein